ncbi:MAG: isoprenyl transferase [Phycisphaerales bacterium]|nr:isoprenyl transferase [Phycisphaerales bacterium]
MPSMSALDPMTRLGVPRERIPRHVAIIMDGNGRWAQQKGQARIEGHRVGAKAVREIVTECARLGLECLTLYSFSEENWRRPAVEVDALMGLYAQYLSDERATILDNNIRCRQIGRREGLPHSVVEQLDITEEASADCSGMTLLLALNYGGRSEIVEAARRIAERAAKGGLHPEDLTEESFAAQLYTRDVIDPDLVIRTAGEMRISNFLLWQISYSELYVSQTLWPDFRANDLHEAFRAFAGRKRRFGAIESQS